MGKPWSGRFAQETNAALERFSASIAFDRALARYDLRCSAAHARMLAACGVISEADAKVLVEGLQKVGDEVERGTFPADEKLEDIHMNIEARLFALVGPTAGRLHSGRSRNDLVATDLVMYLRDTATAARRGLAELRGVLLQRAGEHVETVLPGYTHLQRAQPVRLAHHWHALERMFARDSSRFADLAARITAAGCPLGAGALAGSTLPLERAQTAAALGFARPSANSMDSVAARDFALEFLAAAAICMVQLSRLAEELVLWSSTEFGFVELADEFSTGSSLMPQKKNPDAPELVRAKSGRCIGNLTALLAALKGLPLAYNRDLQEDKEPVFDSAKTLRDSLLISAGALDTLRVNDSKMRQAAEDPMLLSTDLAEALVGHGVPFREAHEAVGKVVAHALKNELALNGLPRAELQKFHPAFKEDAAELLSLERALEQRAQPGGVARAQVRAALKEAAEELAQEETALDAAEAEAAAAEAEAAAATVGRRGRRERRRRAAK